MCHNQFLPRGYWWTSSVTSVSKFKWFHCTLVEFSSKLIGLDLVCIYYCKLHLWISLDYVCLWLITHATEIDRFTSHQWLASLLPQITLGGLVVFACYPHTCQHTFITLGNELFCFFFSRFNLWSADIAIYQMCQTSHKNQLWQHVEY